MKKAEKVTPKADDAASLRSFPIVGIGASAGGLEAMELFFKNVPPGCGLAFVVVQHLDPTRKGMLSELLQRSTSMPVAQIRDHTKVEPEHVYVIPPNRDLSILNGVLHLLKPAAPRGLRLPIDYFLRSLADDQGDHSIGVILSGMGSDGTLGLRAIKEKAGTVFVQDPASAKFDSMPTSAIKAGLADIVAPAEELAGKMLAYFQHGPLLITRPALDVADSDQSGLEKVVLLLRAQTGHDFSLYKKNTIYRRIERRMGLHQLNKIADYVRYLRENSQEVDLLFKELLIGVTSFFRDPQVWEQLKNEVLPALLNAHPNGGMLRAWVPGCSTGEEAYSLAIVFREVQQQIKPSVPYSLQVFATDLDKQAVDVARQGVYPANIAADVTDERLDRFFTQAERGYRVSKEIREMLIFAPHNLVMDPPFTKLDMLTCRNLLIYLEADLQKKLIPLFHYSLNPGGILLLGSSETVGQSNELFISLPGKTRFYRRQDTSLAADLVDFPSAYTQRTERKTEAAHAELAHNSGLKLQAAIETLLLQHYSPAAVLTTGEGDILYISRKTSKYLEPPVGKANLNLFAMSRDGLRGALNESFDRALRERTTITLKNVPVDVKDRTQVVDILIQPLVEPLALRGMMLIVFTDVVNVAAVKAPGKVGRASLRSTHVVELEQSLMQAREEVRITRGEMQISQEELKSTNEELQSINEELQSTNEELTTSKEEMQSMNEELQTVNHELLAKVDELTSVSDDMKNLLNRTDIATLFLDADLNVRRFTSQISRIIKLIPGDVGRPVTDLHSQLDYPDLVEDAHEVLNSLIFRERQICAKGGRWFRVRIMPYRTQDNRIDGLVMTFIDISESTALEETLREAHSVLEGRFTEQSGELDAAKILEGVLHKAQTVLEKRFTAQTAELRQSRADLQTEKGLRL